MEPYIEVTTICSYCSAKCVQCVPIEKFYDNRIFLDYVRKVLVLKDWRRKKDGGYLCNKCVRHPSEKTSVTEVHNQSCPTESERIGCVTMPFALELGRLINKHSVDNELGTPDFMLAAYLVDCLNAWSKINDTREQWFGRKPKPCQSPMEDGTVVVKAHRVVRGIRVPEEEDDKCN